MGTGRYPAGGSHEAADQPSEETTVISDDGEWHVAEQYRVDPPPEAPDERDGRVVIAQNVPPEPVEGPVRKFPPDISSGLLAALLGVLLAVILVPTGLWLASNLDDDDEPSATNTVDTGVEEPPSPGSAQRTVANVVGRQLDDARRVLREARLNVRVRRVDSERPAGLVLAQEPRAGAKLGVGAVVVLTVSGGTPTAPTVEVPDVDGLAASEAIELLENAGFETETRPVPSDQPEDTVIAQVPGAGEEAEEGATVVLDVAAPREADPPPTTTEAAPMVRVPSVVGMRSSQARSRIQGLGLRVTQQPAQSSRPAGEVVGQSPGAGREVREGSRVTLRVSTGPPTVAVPDVVGMTELDAIGELEAAGFVVRVVDEPTLEPTEDGIVLRQSPRPRANRREGSSVTITVARFS